jgi:Tfp pilus tip-associated adhesin PilY1
MSGHHFHVHGPHDHELEHAAHAAGHDNFSGRIAVTTALLAVLAAGFSYLSGATQATAALYKNNAVLKKTEAANQWSYFQAKSTKENIAELAVLLAAPEASAAQAAEVARYAAEKTGIESTARKLEQESLEWDGKSDQQLHLHHRWAQATTALQVAIALAAIALITRRRWLQGVVYGFSGVGALLAVMALLHL